MGNTVTAANLRQQLWSADLRADVIRDCENIMSFMGEDANNVIQVKRDLASKKGQKETFGLIARLKSDGVTGDDELEGNEESMVSYDDSVSIDQVRNAVRSKGKLDSQKVTYDQIKEAREILRIWAREFLCRQFFLKLAGVTNTGLTDTNGVVIGGRALWSNTPAYIPNADEAAGSGNRYLCANVGGTDVIATTDTMTLDLITKAATKAKLTNPKIQPLDLGKGEMGYVMYINPLQARDLRLSSDWKVAHENARERSENNPVFSGALGYWSGVLLKENEFVPYLDISKFAGGSKSFRGAGGSDANANMCRALLCGRQAGLMAEVKNDDALVVETFDYKNKDGVAVSLIGGVSKSLFNSKEFGVIAVDTAATP